MVLKLVTMFKGKASKSSPKPVGPPPERGIASLPWGPPPGPAPPSPLLFLPPDLTALLDSVMCLICFFWLLCICFFFHHQNQWSLCIAQIICLKGVLGWGVQIASFSFSLHLPSLCRRADIKPKTGGSRARTGRLGACDSCTWSWHCSSFQVTELSPGTLAWPWWRPSPFQKTLELG